MNFVVQEMTSLRYFIPMIIEGNRQGIESSIYYNKNLKYNCPYKHIDNLNYLSKKYNFNLLKIDSLNKSKNITFYVEGVGREYGNDKAKNITFTYQNDFDNITANNKKMYFNYLENFDNVIFPSEYFANFHNTVSSKNLYLGSPKYDVKFNHDEICKKYNITSKKNILVLFPKLRDANKIDLKKIYTCINDLGYKIIVKTRGKDPVNHSFYRGDYYFEDTSWYPHCSMELMFISNAIINFGSTSVKECVMMRKPLINFAIKPRNKRKTLPFLYEYEYCKNMPINFSEENFKKCLNDITNNDFSKSFNIALKNHLFDYSSTKKIFEYFKEDIHV